MIMSLRDQLSKDLKTTIANLDKMKKQVDLGTKSTKDANTWWKNAQTQLKSFNTAIIALGVSSVVAGFGIDQLVNASQNISKANAQAEFTTSLLGPAAQDAYNQMKPNFASIGASVLATASQVNQAYGIMSASSGLATLSTQDLQAAFTVSKVTGVDFATAAQDVGMALRGNQDPLRQLVGPYGYKGLSDVIQKAGAAFQDNITPTDKMNYELAQIKDTLATALTPALGTIIGWFNNLPMPLKTAAIAFGLVTAAIVALALAFDILAANPVVLAITAIIAAVVLLGVGIYELATHWSEVWGAIKKATEDVWNWIKDNWHLLADIILAPFLGPLDLILIFWKQISQAASDAWDNIKLAWGNVETWFVNIWTNIKSAWDNVGTWFSDKFSTAWANIKSAWGNVETWFSNLWKNISGGFSDFCNGLGTIWSKIWRTTANLIIDGINLLIKGMDVIPGVNISLIPQIAESSPVTAHANGGLITEPTAMIGLYTGRRGIMAERGPEAIVPQGRGGGSTGNVTFQLFATVADKNALQSFAQQLAPYLQQNGRRGPATSLA